MKCSVKITCSCIFRHSSWVLTSSETWGMYFVCIVLRLILPFCKCNLFNHGALRMRSRSNLNFEELVFKERGKAEYPEKTSGRKGENQQQTQPTYGFDAGIWTRATLVGGECSHHCATLAPPVSTTIQILILQTDLHIFPLRIFEKIWEKIRTFSLWWSFLIISSPNLFSS